MILSNHFIKYVTLFFSCFFIVKFITNFFSARLTTEREKETSAMFVEESSTRKSSTLVVVGSRAKELMKDYLIIVDELYVIEGFVPKETTVRVRTPTENESRGSCTPLIKVQAYLTLFEVIMGAATHFKRKKILTSI